MYCELLAEEFWRGAVTPSLLYSTDRNYGEEPITLGNRGRPRVREEKREERLRETTRPELGSSRHSVGIKPEPSNYFVPYHK